MKKALLFLAKLSVVVLLFLGMEGLLTMGTAFEFQHYGPVAWIAQGCVVFIALYTASKEWGE